MSVKHWTDYHVWHVSLVAMGMARIALPNEKFNTLEKAARIDGFGFVAPREAIEDAALAMPMRQAVLFLGAVYDLSEAQADKLLTAIIKVRGLS